MSPYLCNVANGGHKPAYKIQSAYMNNSNIERFKTNENSLKRVVQKEAQLSKILVQGIFYG